jgi:hypothetical protein
LCKVKQRYDEQYQYLQEWLNNTFISYYTKYLKLEQMLLAAQQQLNAIITQINDGDIVKEHVLFGLNQEYISGMFT